MGLFRRKPNREREIAAALARRGVDGRATVVAMRETGATREAVAREIAFTLDVETGAGAPVRVEHTQFMNRFTLHGLAPGEQARILYDSEDPHVLAVRGHVRFRTEVVAGEIVVVEVADLDARTPPPG